MRIQFSSLIYLRDIKTFITYFFITPIIQMILFVLINQQYSNTIDYNIALSSVFISVNASAINTINQLLVTDKILGIHTEMIVHKPYAIKYWFDKIATVYFSSLLLFLINICILAIFGVTTDQMYSAIALLPFSILYSLLIGVIAFYLAINMSNIYFFNNIFMNILPIISGLAIPIATYPAIFKNFSMLFPYDQLLTAIHTNQVVFVPLLTHFVIVGLISALLYRYRIAFQKK